MGRWHNRYVDGHAHFCTATVAGWRSLLTVERIQVVYREWAAARQDYGVKILAYVVMPNHFHVVLWSEKGENVLKFLHRTLTLTSRTFRSGGGFWKERPRVLAVRPGKVFRVKVDYLHANPVRGRLVADPADWPHSSYAQLVLGRSDVPFRCDEWSEAPA